MRFTSSQGRPTAHTSSFSRIWPLLTALLSTSSAINLTPVASPNLDLSQLGRVGLTGNFDGISLYQYTEQSENGYSTNGSQSVLTQLPDGAFVSVAASDAFIMTMCPFVMQDGKLAGVVVAGNFTSLGGIEAQAAALLDPSTGAITPLTGLSGKVYALYCDQASNTVYVGGDFKGANSTNALAWVGTDGWTNLPFEGFNGPVRSITKTSNGTIVFGGDFSNLGNTTGSGPAEKDQQVINLSAANLTSGVGSSTPGFSDPHNIVCKSGPSGPGNTWLLQDNSPGYWRADFRFGFRPTKLRLWNTDQDGRGTKTFRFTALPIDGIMNLTYTDANGQNATCDARCPLPQSTNYTDFHFVNVIGMSSVQIDISDWYGPGGGLNGIELFEDDIYVFAINDFNEPACAGAEFPSTATTTGPWSEQPSEQSNSDYLLADISGASISSSSASVVFEADIKQSGNYTVTLYTPGCIQDNSCDTRGSVSVTGTMATGTNASPPIQSEIFQTNNYDKYDEIYSGYVDANSGAFRPTVTLAPSNGQSGNLKFVAQRVRFELLSSDAGLNGLFEWNPNLATVNPDFTTSVYDKAGLGFDPEAIINAFQVTGQEVYVGGNFSTSDYENIVVIDNGSPTSLADGGLNAEVLSLYLDDDTLYVAGNFTNTSTAGTDDLTNVASYSTTSKQWAALGAGVNGLAASIAYLSLNVTAGKPETVIAFSGDFDQILAFGSNPAVSVSGLAIWVPSRNNWLDNINAQVPSIQGQLSVTIDIPGGGSLFAGSLSSQGLSASGVVSLSTSASLGLSGLGLQVQPQTSPAPTRKRSLSTQNITGVVAGVFYETSSRNVTILGGHFTAKASNNSQIQNLAFINGSNSDAVTGLPSGLDADSVITDLAVSQDVLYAGGSLSGTINGANVAGLFLYDLVGDKFVSPQPGALVGTDVSVNAISVLPGGTDVYIGGNFESAGSLACPSVCIWTSSASQWNQPGSGLSGTVETMEWSGNTKLVVGGNLTVNDTATSVATYDVKAHQWTTLVGANAIPGPVTVMTPAVEDSSQWWVAGQSANGSAFLLKFDGFEWHSVGNLLGPNTLIRGIQVLSLTKAHDTSALVDKMTSLLVTGELNLPTSGNASSALYNGTDFVPFALSSSGNDPGSLSTIFSQNQNFFKGGAGKLAVGFVVLIALAIALALIFILVVIGIFAERLRRKREGYALAPTQMYDKHSNMDRIPPQHLFGALGPQQEGRGPGGAPMI